MVKSSQPVRNDIVKAAKNIQNKKCTKAQASKVLAKNKAIDRNNSKLSYQLLIPYLERFESINPGTYTCYIKNNKNQIIKFFLCPGIMNNKLRYVRPIVSLDATHLSSEDKGTLYLATVKSGSNEVLPIAFCITKANENFVGWKYFLEGLRKSCPILTTVHPSVQCQQYRLFTFISDRDKGLLPALKEVFPNNHATNCKHHIKQNVKNRFGLKVCNLVSKIGQTFSIRHEAKLLNDIRKLNRNAEEYVLAIDAKTWRNTEWIRNPSLPPRYGVLTSNNAETVNSMFKEARGYTWVRCLDQMLHLLQVRIDHFNKEYSGKKGMIAELKKI